MINCDELNDPQYEAVINGCFFHDVLFDKHGKFPCRAAFVGLLDITASSFNIVCSEGHVSTYWRWANGTYTFGESYLYDDWMEHINPDAIKSELANTLIKMINNQAAAFLASLSMNDL